MSRFFEWTPYVPVAERRAKAKAEMEKLRKKKGLNVQPVEISGRKIAASFWGKGWCDHMESFHDYANRLPRGRTYARNGSVCHLEINSGSIEAMVSGSQIYNVVISIAPIAPTKWKAVKASCAGQIGSLIDLLRGRLASGVMEVVSHRSTGLFPLPGEIRFHCDCPDSAKMCKHIAAVLYGVGARLDHAPEKLFHLRGVNHEEMVDVSSAIGAATAAKGSRRRLAANGLDDIFGINLAGARAGSGKATDSEAEPWGIKSQPAAMEPPLKKAKAKTTAASKEEAAASSRKAKAKAAAAALSAEPAKLAAKHTPPIVAPDAKPFPKRLTGKVILSWRSTLGETQGQFASRISVSAGCISQWEKKLRETLQVRERALDALKRAWDETH